MQRCLFKILDTILLSLTDDYLYANYEGPSYVHEVRVTFLIYASSSMLLISLQRKRFVK